MAQADNRIIHGDCLRALAKLDADSVDLVFADPPFNIGYDYDEYDDNRAGEEYVRWSRDWIGAVKRVLKPHGTFWLAIGDEYAAELKVAATHDVGFVCRNWVVWYYTFGVHCRKKFTRSHTHLFYFVQDAKRCTFNADAIRVPSARQLVYGDKRANPKGRVPDDTWLLPPWSDDADDGNGRASVGPKSKHGSTSFVLRPQDLPDGFSSDSDTWYYPRVCGTFRERRGFHGCQMPEQLLGRIIRACSNEGDLVLDPFAGSATTLIVAKKLGRRSLGVEISKQYAVESRERLRNTKVGDPLDGFENPLTSVPNTANGTIRTKGGRRIRRGETT